MSLLRLQKLDTVLTQTLKKLNVLSSEYEKLEQVPPAPGCPEDQHDAMVAQGLCKAACKHPTWNRYCNQYPLDCNIVTVPEVPYINASWIQMPKGPRYIVTMGPMRPEDMQRATEGCPDTCCHFWKMIWHLKAAMIVMLCQVQHGFTGCSQYFPTNGGETLTFGELSVRLDKCQKFEGFKVRTLTIENKTLGTKQQVQHFQYLLWPNYGIPEGVEELSNFVEQVKLFYDDVSGVDDFKLVVHCSGGLGRSGTFLTVFIMYDFLREFAKGIEIDADKGSNSSYIAPEEEINLLPIVWTMRLQRHPWMVEGIHQYQFAYQTILKLLSRLCSSVSPSHV